MPLKHKTIITAVAAFFLSSGYHRGLSIVVATIIVLLLVFLMLQSHYRCWSSVQLFSIIQKHYCFIKAKTRQEKTNGAVRWYQTITLSHILVNGEKIVDDPHIEKVSYWFKVCHHCCSTKRGAVFSIIDLFFLIDDCRTLLYQSNQSINQSIT